MRELVVDLKRALRLSSGEIVPEHRRGKVPPRRRRVITAIAAAIAVMVAGVLWFLWERDYFWRNPLADARIERVTDFDGDEVDAAISPDGKFMSFLSDRDGRIDDVTSPTTDVPENIVRNSAASMKRSRYAPRIENGAAVPTENVVFVERVLVRVTTPTSSSEAAPSGKAAEKAPEAPPADQPAPAPEQPPAEKK